MQHLATPEGMELQAGAEIGRHEILTHAYWREPGPEIGDLHLFGVAPAPDEDAALAHKDAIDHHQRAAGVPIRRSGVLEHPQQRAALPDSPQGLRQ